jgi:hypothetical protein
VTTKRYVSTGSGWLPIAENAAQGLHAPWIEYRANITHFFAWAIQEQSCLEHYLESVVLSQVL